MMRRTFLIFFLLNIFSSCQEGEIVESIDSNLLVGEWKGEQIWDSYQDNILHTSLEKMYLKFTQEGRCTLHVENSAEDTIYYDWFYIPGNHKLFLTAKYTNLRDTTWSDTYISQYHDIQTINSEQLVIEKITSRIHQGTTYRNEFNWNLDRVK